MTETPEINVSHIRRYRRWKTKLHRMCRLYESLEDARGTPMEQIIRVHFQDAARAPDNLIVPQPWKSWEHLGDAIYGRRRFCASNW